MSPTGLPESPHIGLVRGSLENMEALFGPPPLAITNSTSDAALVHREFVGPAARFAALDASDDGLIDVGEAE